MFDTHPKTNNWRNWWPIFSTYLYIAAVVAGALWFFRWRETQVHWWTDIPVAIFAIALIGPAQHRLLLLGQEAALGCLFRNRWLNELVGDWLLHFPFSLATQQVRYQLLTHYQFTNDPERDAELEILQRAGFWPLKIGRLGRLSAIIRWHSLRTNYSFETKPLHSNYDATRPPSGVALHIGTAYVLLMFAVLIYLYLQPNEMILLLVPPAMWALVMCIFIILPANKYQQSKLSSLYSPKVMTLMRITFITLVNSALGWTTYLTERSGVLNYIALWIAPYFTTTAALMILRHWRQHGPQQTMSRSFFARLLLFPLRQTSHEEKHREPNKPWFALGKIAK